MDSHRFEKLEVWRVSHAYVLDVYRITSNFPQEEKYSLVDQLRRSSASVPTNIVEGNERKTKKEYIQFLYIAKSSLAESRYQIILSGDLHYIDDSIMKDLLKKNDEIGKMINGLIRYLRST